MRRDKDRNLRLNYIQMEIPNTEIAILQVFFKLNSKYINDW